MSVAALKGWSRVLVTSTVLALNTFLNLGLATSTPNGTVAAAFTNVQAQETDTQGDVIVEEMLGDGDRSISHKLYDNNSGRLFNEGIAGATFGETALTKPVNVKLTVSEVPATDYPDADYFAQNYQADEVRHLGPLVTVDVPLDALNWQAEDEKSLILITPSFYEGALETTQTRNIFLEVRIPRTDGQLVFYTFDYGFLGKASITGTFLQTNLLGSVPETLKISVQAVDLSRILPDPGALPGTMPE